MAATAAVSRTSSRAVSDTPSLARDARAFSSMSVANTLAPSRANASAQARPMPTAAAVTNARLPFRRSDMEVSLEWSRLFLGVIRGLDPRIHLLRKKDGLPGQARQQRFCELMIIPRDAELAGDVLVARCKLHAGAG